MKDTFTFLILLMVAFMSIVVRQAPKVDLIVQETPANKTMGTAQPEPTPSPTPITLPEHIWPPTLGTTYENERLEGTSHRFDIAEPQLLIAFAYRNMVSGLPCTVALKRNGERNSEMNWPWDTKLRAAEGRMVLDLWTIMGNRQPGDHIVEIWVGNQLEQRIEFELLKHSP